MSIIVNDLSYHYPNQSSLFGKRLNFAVKRQEKIAIVGNNGTGKSTLLQLMAGRLQPVEGNIIHESTPYYIPQHTGKFNKNIAEILGVNEKLKALHAIEQGSIRQSDFDTLSEDWEIESKCEVALSHWQLPHLDWSTPADHLSGGEITKVFLAGLTIHTPEIILLDEPTNHLDQSSRELFYRYLRQSKATLIIVSHDIALLDQLHTTYELSPNGIKMYGGNYTFYKEQKTIETNALNDSIHEEEKMLRLARKKAQEVKQRQEKRAGQGEKNRKQAGEARILLNALGNAAENTASKLKDKHAEIIQEGQHKLTELKKQQDQLNEIKIDFDNTKLHAGKLLIDAVGINVAYATIPLWTTPLDFKLYSHDRIHIQGNNGAGKTTLIQLLTGITTPSCGQIRQSGFTWIYLDQHYTNVDVTCTVEQIATQYNCQSLKEHEIKLRLNRFLFTADQWNKPCNTLSGGEKMRLYLCCLMISNQTPDLIILDEPTNNLDIASLQLLTQTIKNYKGSLLVISHDKHFSDEIGLTREILLHRKN
jgi:ATPase subunit of ABC transporter with duplicated ATPase domains